MAAPRKTLEGAFYSFDKAHIDRMQSQITSRERLLRAINLGEVEHVPCCFMSFTALRRRVGEDLYKLVEAELAMGLDSVLFIPAAPRPERRDHPDLRGLPVRFHPEVTTTEWREPVEGDFDVLHKEYTTPAGKLSTSVRLSEDWTHGDHIPFVDDFQVPRALKPLITGSQDLPALDYLLMPPSAEDVARFEAEAERAGAFAEKHGVLVAGGWGVGADMANWLCGMQDLMVLMLEQPSFVADLLERIHAWNKQRMEVVLSAPVDLFIRRAWYEGCDFVTPDFFRQSILPALRVEAELAHEHGAKFGYICSSGTAPLLDYYLEADIDILIGIDPIQGTHTDMALLKEKLGRRVCLWGGVSGAITVETGSAEEVRAAVRTAVHVLGLRGFILSPVDNITVDAPQTWNNVQAFIDEWRRL